MSKATTFEEDCRFCGSGSGDRSEVWSLRLRKKLLSLNAVGTNKKGRAGQKYRTEHKWYKKKFLVWAPDVGKATGFRQVTITRQYVKQGLRTDQRPYDYDNMVGGCKPIVDALRDTGLIRNDDKRANVVVRYAQEPIDSKQPQVLIEIEEFN